MVGATIAREGSPVMLPWKILNYRSPRFRPLLEPQMVDPLYEGLRIPKGCGGRVFPLTGKRKWDQYDVVGLLINEWKGGTEMTTWKLNRGNTGYNEEEFCRSKIVVSNEAIASKLTSVLGLPTNIDVDIISPNHDGQLIIVPYSKVASFVKTGDILVYLEPDRTMDMSGNSWVKIIKQLLM